MKNFFAWKRYFWGTMSTFLVAAVAILLAVGINRPVLAEETKVSLFKPLTELTPKDKYSYDNFLCVNETSSGAAINIGKNNYQLGLSMHPATDATGYLTYDISGLGYNTFTAIVGKDRSAGDAVGGDAGIEGTKIGSEIWVDGVKVAESGDIAYPYSYTYFVDIAGASELKLVINDGHDGIYCDTTSWANPILTSLDYKSLTELTPVQAHSVEGEGASAYSLNNSVCVGGSGYSTGFSIHPYADAPAEIVFDVSDLNYKYFYTVYGKDLKAAATVGVDGIIGSHVGSEIWLDGVKVAESGSIGYPYTYSYLVDIEGAKELKIVFYDGGDSYYCDMQSIADPILFNADLKDLTEIVPSQAHSIYGDGADAYDSNSGITVGETGYAKGFVTHPDYDAIGYISFDLSDCGYDTLALVWGKDISAGAAVGIEGITGTRAGSEIIVNGITVAASGNLEYPGCCYYIIDIADATELKISINDGQDGIYCDSQGFTGFLFNSFREETPVVIETDVPEITPDTTETPVTDSTEKPTDEQDDTTEPPTKEATGSNPSTGDTGILVLVGVVMVSATLIVLNIKHRREENEKA
jgi:hypothetical protein